jgi:hypothetical protein
MDKEAAVAVVAMVATKAVAAAATAKRDVAEMEAKNTVSATAAKEAIAAKGWSNVGRVSDWWLEPASQAIPRLLELQGP